MCCVFASFAQKELPAAIRREDDARSWLFDFLRVPADDAKARRVESFLAGRLGKEAGGFLRRAHLTCLEDKELHMLRFVQLGCERGPAVWDMLTDDRVGILYKAVLHRSKETEKYKGFLRFSLYQGVMLAAISPKNFILPALGAHFIRRFPGGQFIIYDKTHHTAFVYSQGRHRFSRIEEFTMPDFEQEELACRRLWRMFFDKIAIKERENPRCQMTHLPKRYRADMTEFQKDPPKGCLPG